ncbi:MAG: hypothetical protein JW749_12680 [Sedimentisphaerales bacterium]|nr:hypothetical protein [Sedimentisphaerales bacterium]
MKRLRKTHRHVGEQTKWRKKIKKYAFATGAAAAMAFGAAGTNKALAADTPDPHQLPVSGDTDGDLLADIEEDILGYLNFNPDQNRNLIPDGVELANLCATDINDLPWEDDAAPGQTYKWWYPQMGLHTCEICGATMPMGPGGVTNPTKGITVTFPFQLTLHYLEHGSFSYDGYYGEEPVEGRVDVPALLQALDVSLPLDPNDHQLPVPNDSDTDLLSDKEEFALGYQPFNDDQNKNAVLDGVELAKRVAQAVEQLPPQSQAGPNEIYKIEHPLDGLEQCLVCGQWIHMGGWEIVNPRLNLRYPDPCDPMEGVFLPDLTLHYMQHGSFSCAGSIHTGRVNIPLLNRVLEMRFPFDPNTHQLPLTYDVNGIGQLAPDANDLDGDLMADTEELKAGYNLYDADQDEDLLPDGIELAGQCSRAIDDLPIYDPYGGQPEPNEPYKVSYFQHGLERCEICGEMVNMGWWEVINPRLCLSINVYDITCHYMSHGSFSYSGTQIEPPYDPFHAGRVDLALLTYILEMPRKCGDLGINYLPGDYNKDCKQDFIDFADFADSWLKSTDPNENGTAE